MNTDQSAALGSRRGTARRAAAAADWNHKRSVNETRRLSSRRRSATRGGPERSGRRGPACNYKLHYSGSATDRPPDHHTGSGGGVGGGGGIVITNPTFDTRRETTGQSGRGRKRDVRVASGVSANTQLHFTTKW